MVNDDGVPPAASEPDAGSASALTAEWALWGKRATETTYHVLEWSDGTLTEPDFTDHINRYAHGTADRLPQYTVGWVPGADSDPEFVTLAIHEHAPYGLAQSGGRSRYDARGREIVFVRLFCVRYADLAEHGVSYSELLDAVQRQELPPGGETRTAPATIRIPSRQPPQPAAGPVAELAETVAVLLLTDAPVCVLGTDDVPATDRLAFIDLVMSLLPYGLRARMSASTWASSTAQTLKLRLFFASAPRDDGGRTRHVRWEQSGPAGFADLNGETAQLYLDWLGRTGPRARSVLAGRQTPLRFTDADIRQMVAALPRDVTLADALEDLAASLGDGVVTATQAEVRRLERYLAGPLDHAERDRYRHQVLAQGLLRDQLEMDLETRESIYHVLLNLAFETPLTYASYCDIEEAIGRSPRGPLRTVMLRLNFTTIPPWLLTTKAEPEFADEELMEGLGKQGVPATVPLDELQREIESLRQPHRAIIYDFSVRYLRAQAEDPRAEVRRRGYLAEMLEAVFPGDRLAQRIRLEDTLRLVHGGPLSRGQIRELFADPETRPTAAFEAAVVRLASSPKAGPFVAEQAAYARLRYAGYGSEPQTARRSRRWHPLIRR